MIAEYNLKSLAFGIPSLLIQILCTVISNLLQAHAKNAGEVLAVLPDKNKN